MNNDNDNTMNDHFINEEENIAEEIEKNNNNNNMK